MLYLACYLWFKLDLVVCKFCDFVYLLGVNFGLLGLLECCARFGFGMVYWYFAFVLRLLGGFTL